jgi:hypothetical protein
MYSQKQTGQGTKRDEGTHPKANVAVLDKKEKRRAGERRCYLKEKKEREARRKELDRDWQARELTPQGLRWNLIQGQPLLVDKHLEATMARAGLLWLIRVPIPPFCC